MRLSNNNKLIQRNKKISQIVLYASLALLTLGFLWSFTNPQTSQAVFAYVILVPAYILVQVSIYMANKWGRSPRPDEIIISALKGMNNQFSLYNYNTGVPHLLVCPAGIWIIKPYHHSGKITYNPDKKRYEQKGGPGFISKLFAQESLPDIEKDSKVLMGDHFKFIKDHKLTIKTEPKIINFFYSEKAEINAKNAPEITLYADKLKDFIRQEAKKNIISDPELVNITKQLPGTTD